MQKKFALKGVINRGIHQGDIYLLIFFPYSMVVSCLKHSSVFSERLTKEKEPMQNGGCKGNRRPVPRAVDKGVQGTL